MTGLNVRGAGVRRLFSTPLFLILFAASSAQAQTPTPTPTPSLERQFFKNLFKDQKAIWTSPFHARPSDVWWLAPLGVGTAALIATDRETGDKIAEYPQLLDVSHAVSYAGEGYTVAGAALTFYVVGRAAHNDRARETGLLSAEALVNSWIVVGVAKSIARRARPTAGEDRSKFFVGGTSFPSGHTIQIWSVATVVAHEYHDRPAVQIAAYAIASAVGVARFTGQNHYLSDVLVGGALGYGIGRYVYRTHHLDAASAGTAAGGASRLWPSIAPEYNRKARAYGLTLSWVY